MTTYELRIHARDVSLTEEGLGDIGKHTGYDLITTNEDGTQTIQYIDLYRQAGKINFYITKTPITVVEYTLTDDAGTTRNVKWGNKTFHNGQEIDTTEDYLKTYQAYSGTLISGPTALTVFNKIKLEATILSQVTEDLTYDYLDRNCNTCTNYFAEEYLNGQDVFVLLPEATYRGAEDPFYDPNSTSTTDVTIKSVRNILDKYYSLVGSNVDLSNVQYGVVNQSNGWYAQFTADSYNYLFAGNGEPTIVDSQGDSFIYATSGNNNIDAGNGDDRVYGREANVINGGEGNDIIYAGDQTLAAHSINGGAGDDIIYAGHGSDDVRGGSGNNTVYLGSGSDKYTGGNNVDIVDGGSANFEFTDSKDSSFEYTLSADLIGDINTIHLEGGNDEYTGGIGVDKVWSGIGDDTINTGAGNDMVYTTDGSSSDKNTVNLGSGSDYFEGGNGIDIVYGGNDDASGDVNTVNLGGGEDIYYGSDEKDIVHGGADDDHIYGYDGNNELYGDAGSDHIYGGNDNDKLYGGSGRDYLYPGKGINTVDCGLDTHTDIVVINNDANGVDTIYHVSARDIISCGGGFNLSSLEQVGNDIVIYGNLGNKIILKDVKLPEQEEPNGENMPVLYQPDGTLLQWGEDGYSSGSTTFPPYSEEPENLDALPNLPRAGSSIPVIPADPENGTIQQQNDKPLTFSESVKYNIKELIDESMRKESPLVVDLNGDGQIETIGTDSGIYFDLDNNQKVENSGWIGRNDGFLVRDLNNNGQIDDGTELFGNNSVLSSGEKAANDDDINLYAKAL